MKCELYRVYSSYIVFLEIPTLNHEILDDSVEEAALVYVPFVSFPTKTER
jgi:hypothetical protein